MLSKINVVKITTFEVWGRDILGNKERYLMKAKILSKH